MACSLYRKYRPQTFSDVVGQEHVERTLKNAVIEGNVSHAYLLCGPRGTGKTTTARLLAKALLCEKGPDHEPDGTCEQCRDVADGTHPDVYELDAASRTGVDNVREEIIGRVQFAPVRGRYKVYIIDEVHMLSTAAFNALLKTLEEPPDHIVFILCTTDPQKVPATILSRCQRFDFHRLSGVELVGRLSYICEHEGISADADALDLIAQHAQGGMRDAITSLEQLAVFSGNAITKEDAEGLLGEVHASQLFEVAQLISTRDVARCFGWVARFVESGTDLIQFARDLTMHMRDLYVVALTGGGDGIVDVDSEELALYVGQAGSFGGTDRLARILVLMGDLLDQLRTAADPRLCVEVAFTRMARPDSDLTIESLSERVEALEKGTVSAVPQGLAAVPDGGSVATDAITGRLPEVKESPLVPRGDAAGVGASVDEVETAGVASSAPEVPAGDPIMEVPSRPDVKPSIVAGISTDRTIDRATAQRLWLATSKLITRKDPPHAAVFAPAMVETGPGNSLVISFPPGSSFSFNLAKTAEMHVLLSECLREVFGWQVPFKLVIGEATAAPSRSVRSSSTARAAGRATVPATETMSPRPIAPTPVSTPVSAPDSASVLTSVADPVPPSPGAFAATSDSDEAFASLLASTFGEGVVLKNVEDEG
jgi:DNA polymerase-3 subunit gamma/tau